MGNLELGFLLLAFIGLVLGCWGVAWARTSQTPRRVVLGRCLCFAALLLLGGSGAFAVLHHIESLIPLGLTSGFLVMAMLYEAPHPAWHD